jgi:acyl-coenzyme A synthetase/AMP-(fatty) acid ligase
VNTFEVEEKLLRHPDVVTVVALAIPSLLGDGTKDETKVSVVAREDSITERDFNERDLLEWSVKNITRFQVLSVSESMRSIAKTLTRLSSLHCPKKVVRGSR